MLTGLQVINEIEDRLGWPQSPTLEGSVKRDTRKILLVLNRVLKNMGALEQWPMLRQEGTIITEASLAEDVLLDMTNGSTTVTLSTHYTSAPLSGTFRFAAAHKVWAIQFGEAGTPIYRIAKVVSPTEIELNRVWIGTTVAPTAYTDDTISLKMAMDQYVLPEDFDRPTGEWEDFLSSYNVTPVGPELFSKTRRTQGSTLTCDYPQIYTVYGLDPSETYQVLHFNPWPSEQTMMEYSYQRTHPKIEQDTDKILFQQTHLGMIIESVLSVANRDYEDDQRAQSVLMEFMTQFNAVRSQNGVAADKKCLSPWTGYRGRSFMSSGAGSFRYDYGTYFDVAGNTGLK
jgi:hypothetical protein